MMPSLEQIAQALGGGVFAGQVRAPAPGHSAADRGLCVKIKPDAPDGFLVRLFNEGGELAAKDYVRQKVGLPAWKPNGKGNGHAYTPPGGKFGTSALAPKISTTLQAALRPAEPAPTNATEAVDFARQCAEGALYPSAKPAVRTLIAEYDYHDLDGALLYHVQKFSPKSFVQRRPRVGQFDLDQCARVALSIYI
jgi:hypothetical protein